MKNKHIPTLFGLILIIILTSTLLLALSPAPTQAGAPLPSRSTPTPVSNHKHKDNRPVGAHIELQIQHLPAGAWTVVQWQDSTGGWHDVEGLQGVLDAGGYQCWWVAAKDFGTGPFR